MKKGGITINQSGGNAVFGNVTQGDGNKNVATSSMTITESDTAFREFFDEIQKIREDAAVSDKEAAELAAEVAALEKELGQQGPGALISKAAKQIYERYSWAAKPLARLFGVIGA